MSRAVPRVLVVGVVIAAGVAVPGPAVAKPKGPTQIVPTTPSGQARREARRTEVDRSEGGTRQGVLELSLGSVVAATSGILIGRGIWEVVGVRRTIEACEAGSNALECLFPNPGRQGSIAAGLSFGFSAVLGVAAGFLLVRGVRINRDYRSFRRATAHVSVEPWASVRRPGPAGGLSLRVRF